MQCTAVMSKVACLSLPPVAFAQFTVTEALSDAQARQVCSELFYFNPNGT